MVNDKVEEVIKELFKSLKNRYQNNLESIKGSEFVFNYIYRSYMDIIIYGLYMDIIIYGSHIDSPD